MKVGDSFDDFCKLIPYSKPKTQGIDRFITRIDKPCIYRSTDNTNKKTYDFISIDVFFLATMDKKEAQEYAKKHINEIFDKVKQILISSPKFQNYGVPISFLKCSYKIHLPSSSIHFLFSLKEISEPNKNNEDIDNKDNSNPGR